MTRTPAHMPYPDPWSGTGESRERRMRQPDFINAVVLGRALAEPVDSWVYLFRTQAPPVAVALGSALLLIAALAVDMKAVSLLLTASDAGTIARYVLGVLVMSVITAVLATILVVIVRGRHRAPLFGTRTLGAALGEHSVLLNLVDGEHLVLWQEMQEIEGAVAPAQARASQPVLRLTITTSDGPHTWVVNNLAGDPWLLYCALRFYLEHPDARSELGRSDAGRRFEAWSRS